MNVVEESKLVPGSRDASVSTNKGNSDKKRFTPLYLAGAPFAFLLVFFVAPAIVLLISSFWLSKSFTMIPAATLANYARVLGASGFYDSLWISLQNGFWTALLSTLLSAPVAWYIVYRARSNAILYLALVSWFSSYLVRVYAWRTILGSNGVINSSLMQWGLIDSPIDWIVFNKFSVVITLVHIMLPFTLLLLVSGLRDVKKDYLEACADLGGSSWVSLRKVIIPMAHKSIVSSFMFTFVLAAADYVTPQLLGGRDAMTTGLLIANQFRTVGNWPLGAAMAYLLLMVFMLVYAALLLCLRAMNLAPGKRYHD